MVQKKLGREIVADFYGITPETYILAKEEIQSILGRLKEIVNTLHLFLPRHSYVIRMRCGLNSDYRKYTLKEIGSRMKITKEGVRQIKKKVTELLQEIGLLDADASIEDLLDRLWWAMEIVPDMKIDSMFEISEPGLSEVYNSKRQRLSLTKKHKIINQRKACGESIINQIIQEVASFFSVSIDNIFSRSRVRTITLARHVAIYVLRNKYNFTFVEIVRILNLSCYGTAYSGYWWIKAKIHEPEFALKIGKLMEKLKDILKEEKASKDL